VCFAALLVQKVAIACGSMVLYILLYMVFTPVG
jgi:hypothetical protein